MIYYSQIKKEPPKSGYTPSSELTQEEKQKLLEQAITERKLWDLKVGDSVLSRASNTECIIHDIIEDLDLLTSFYLSRINTLLVSYKLQTANNNKIQTYWYSPFELYKLGKDGKPLFEVDSLNNPVLSPKEEYPNDYPYYNY